MKNVILGEILLNVASFPSMPGAGVKMLTLLEQPEIPISDIEKVLRHDPGLTANVLKLANSAYFGMPSKVGSLKQAVMLLGFKRLTQLVVATCANAVMDKAVAGYNLPPGDLWRHSIAVSIAAEALAREKKIAEPADVFTPALLHDVGKLALGRFVKEELAAIKRISAQGVPLVVAENMVLGTDHAEIGAQILAQWSFPPDIVKAVRWHHDPDSIKNANLQIDVVYLANHLCRTKESDGENAGQTAGISPAVIKRMGITTDQLILISEKIAGWIEKFSEALSFD